MFSSALRAISRSALMKIYKVWSWLGRRRGIVQRYITSIDPLTMTKGKQFAFFFFTEMVSYFLIVANTRAFTLGFYWWTGLTDFIFAGSNFYLFQKVAKVESNMAWLGYTLGGTTGSLVSMWVTIHLYGK